MLSSTAQFLSNQIPYTTSIFLRKLEISSRETLEPGSTPRRRYPTRFSLPDSQRTSLALPRRLRAPRIK